MSLRISLPFICSLATFSRMWFGSEIVLLTIEHDTCSPLKFKSFFLWLFHRPASQPGADFVSDVLSISAKACLQLLQKRAALSSCFPSPGHTFIVSLSYTFWFSLELEFSEVTCFSISIGY